jgi:hypothetical protein
MRILIMIFVLIAGLQIPYQLSREIIVTTVNKTERVCSKEDCRYLIFTDSGVLENTDSLLNFKFNSSDFYNDIVAGKKYQFRTVGWRIPFLSMYENVLDYQEVQ